MLTPFVQAPPCDFTIDRERHYLGQLLIHVSDASGLGCSRTRRRCSECAIGWFRTISFAFSVFLERLSTIWVGVGVLQGFSAAQRQLLRLC